jgi:hypothetical protein
MKELEIQLLEQIIARLSIIRDGWQHKSKWNNELGTTYLDLYVKDYKDRLKLLLDDDESNKIK